MAKFIDHMIHAVHVVTFNEWALFKNGNSHDFKYLSYLESKSKIFQNRLLADFVQKRAIKRSSVGHRFHHGHMLVDRDLDLSAATPSKTVLVRGRG